MADAVIDLQASNIFGLNANFNTTSSTTGTATSNVAINDELGNVACQRNISDMISHSQSATYCGSDFVTDLGTFLTQFGTVQSSKIVTGLSIGMSAEGYATIEVSGHQHPDNAHVAGLSIGYADVSDFLPHAIGEAFVSWDGFGVPDFGVTVGANSSPASASVNFTMNHIDENDEQGDHLVGKNITPRCELSMDFVGLPTSVTISAIQTDLRANEGDMLDVLVDSIDQSDSNSEFDTFSFTAHANPALATA